MFAGLGLAALLVQRSGGQTQTVPKMNDQDIRRLLSIARDAKNELLARIRALEEVARAADKNAVAPLQDLWKRARPAPQPNLVNWDPVAADRVVDQYIVLALYRAGDPSRLPEIAVLVSQAGRLLDGPNDELRNAAKVIRAIGRPELVYQLITVASGNKPEACANAVRTLQLLSLPSPASGGPVNQFPELQEPLNFTIHRLSEEIQTMVRLSKGRLEMSSGVRDFIVAKDFDRGEVKRENMSLAKILTEFLDLLDLTYAVTLHGVVLLTFVEAGPRWQQWWREHGSTLKF